MSSKATTDTIEFEPSPPDGRDAESPMEILRRCHRLLRGRWMWTIVLAVLCAGLGGTLGYLSQKPLYQSSGQIHVRPMLGKILYDTEMSDIMPMFRNYVSTQAEFVQSQRVVTRAFETPEWQAFGRGSGPDALERFEERLSVRVEPSSGRLIEVSFLDADPKAAQVATREVIRSYKEIFGDGDKIDSPERVGLLQDRERRLRAEIARRESSIQAIAGELGPEALEERHQARLDEIDELSTQRRALDASLATANAARQEGAPDAPALDAEQIAKHDPEVAGLLQQQRTLLGEVETLKAMGITEAHRDMRWRRRELARLDEKIESLVTEWSALVPSGASGAKPTRTSIATIEAQLRVVDQQLAVARAEAADLADKMRRISQLDAESESDRAELQRVSSRLSQIELESKVQDLEGVTGRISVVSEGSLSHSPAVDRRIPMAAVGGLGLGALPVGLMMLLGLIDGRFRYSDEACDASPAVPMLGVLPRLPNRLEDPEQAAIAAHAVHQARAIIQLWSNRDEGSVVAVTSPTSGDGKTSLSLALGLSLASSGARTLLIDFDMIGRGLSRSLGAGPEGALLEALDSGELDGHVRESGTPRLWVLPAGDDDASRLARLSPGGVERLLQRARESFDSVIVDTGPILGSLEACVAGAAADGVVLAVGRGQQRSNVQKALAQLSTIGARLIGVVFNQAEAGDFERSVSGMSARSTRPDGLKPWAALSVPDDERYERFGPVAKSMVMARGA